MTLRFSAWGYRDNSDYIVLQVGTRALDAAFRATDPVFYATISDARARKFIEYRGENPVRAPVVAIFAGSLRFTDGRHRHRAALRLGRTTIPIIVHQLDVTEVRALLGQYRPKRSRPMTARFNRTNDNVSWAAWTWNPVTGCLHQCGYCCARPIALSERMRKHYPHGFDPAFHPERLDAPANTPVPKGSDARLHRVFVCSMADLYGKWVPDEWIERVHASCIANPQWEYLLLTKFPRRYVGATLPETAWVGTSVDEQKRVRLAEDAFRQIGNVRVKWLSLEPLLAPLEFTDLSMFDWVVIGAQSATRQPHGFVAEFQPPLEWVTRLIDQAHEAGCKVWLKPNLRLPPGMQLIQEEPRLRAAARVTLSDDLAHDA